MDRIEDTQSMAFGELTRVSSEGLPELDEIDLLEARFEIALDARQSSIREAPRAARGGECRVPLDVEDARAGQRVGARPQRPCVLGPLFDH
jgi:hypothetical protein